MQTSRHVEGQRPTAVLIVSRGDEPVLRFALSGRGARVGSHPRNDLSLPVDGVPDFMCEVVAGPRRGHVVVSCRGARLIINGEPVRKHMLQPGDEIELGALTARYLPAGESPQPLTIGSTGRVTISSDGRSLSLAEGRLVHGEGEARRVVPVSVEGLRVGKDEDNDLVLPDRSVSSFHAIIFARGGRYYIRDLESTNGTLVNNLKIVEAELPFGADLRFGRAAVRFEEWVTETKLDSNASNALDEIISSAPVMQRLFNLIERVAAHEAPVCITGETGTGKELVARALHRRSTFADGPFVAVNLGALPDNLVEDELFGHEKGAFTGADRLRPGAFEQAQKGTIFLDEIGELPLSAQPKLLRVLESFQVRRLGGQDSISLELRVLSATHRDLATLVRQGRFREDLLHRLYVLPLALPPLRERVGDVELLSRHFLTSADPSGRPRSLSQEAWDKLLRYTWPGNVRELRNVIVRAALLAEREPIEADAIVFTTATLEDQVAHDQAYRPLQRLDEIERRTIREVLESVGGNRSHASKLLGISRSTLIRKMKELGLSDMPSTRAPSH